MVLIGFKLFKSKAGKDFCVANVKSSYNEREIEKGCVGEKCEEIFLPDEQLHYLTPKDVGREVKAEYEISGGRAYLVNFVVDRPVK